MILVIMGPCSMGFLAVQVGLSSYGILVWVGFPRRAIESPRTYKNTWFGS